jgi:hypothetical protein
MIIARQKAPAPVLSFGQVGGDEFTGLLEPRKEGRDPVPTQNLRIPTSAC